MSHLTRSSVVVAAALASAVLPATGALASAPVAAVHAEAPSRARISTAYVLPGDRVYPEGIAADDRTGAFYAGSYQDGTIYRTTPGRREAEVFLPAGADGRHTANGLRVDRAGRLWVCDSTSGVAVYDTRTRRLIAQFTVPGDAARIVNDVAIGPDGTAWLTDSTRAVVYRVTPGDLAAAGGGRGVLQPRFDLGAVLEPHAPDAVTLNGIVADPSGRHLLVADMTGGDLYRLDVASGAIRKVELRGGDVLHADGLELRGGRLWVVHNTANAISRWRVAADGTEARRERMVTDPALQWPTTLARSGGTLYVVRSQFDKGGPIGSGTPELPFSIAAVRGL
ncbi:SMP-30/gluconolactonase/LRE family protein [Actinomadura roseirufa]|uniref:SMP-30/gluconolactonase/LRE family protein n=1 Tax=Actinomadura roseirufa TaxID=2094049 RepID=UPI001A955E95|nr:SMP-30/gluconolactonase/LRE family protein [Actinomadura roseirufa]